MPFLFGFWLLCPSILWVPPWPQCSAHVPQPQCSVRNFSDFFIDATPVRRSWPWGSFLAGCCLLLLPSILGGFPPLSPSALVVLRMKTFRFLCLGAVHKTSLVPSLVLQSRPGSLSLVGCSVLLPSILALVPHAKPSLVLPTKPSLFLSLPRCSA
jgi:hypothetical protein